MLCCDVWDQESSRWVPGMFLLLQLLPGRGYLLIFGKGFQVTNSKAVQPTEVLLRVTPYKGASVLLIAFVVNTEQGTSACPLTKDRGVLHKTIAVWTTADFH